MRLRCGTLHNRNQTNPWFLCRFLLLQSWNLSWRLAGELQSWLFGKFWSLRKKSNQISLENLKQINWIFMLFFEIVLLTCLNPTPKFSFLRYYTIMVFLSFVIFQFNSFDNWVTLVQLRNGWHEFPNYFNAHCKCKEPLGS